MRAHAARVAVLALGVLGASLVTESRADSVTSGQQSSHQAAAASAERVLFVGVPGLRWDHVSATRTPTLWAFATQSARGALSVRSESEYTCPDAGWLTLGAGNRAADLGRECYARPALSDWPALVERNDEALDGRQIGALGAALVEAGMCGVAEGPALLALGPAGRERSTASGCEVELRELPAVYSAAAAEAADAAFGALLAETPATATGTVIVAGISEGDAIPRPHLHVVAIRGPAFPAGAELSSPSTSRAPYVQLVDLAPTILERLRITAPSTMSGRPVSVHGGGRAPAAHVRMLADLDRRATAQRSAVVPFTVLLVLALLVLVVGALRGWSSRGLRTAAVVVMAMPVASFLAQLVPWWRTGDLRFGALLAVCLAVSAAIAVVATRGPWAARRLGSVAAVAGLTALVLAADLVSGAHLQMDAVFGYSPYVAGRFVGIGNPGFAVLGTAAVLAAALLVTPDARAWAWVAGIGAIAVVVDGSPKWGDDLGGVLALVPAFAVAGSLLSTGRVRTSRLLVAGLGAAALVSGFALADYGRGAGHRTHLGRFVEQVRDGTAGQVIHRKAQANLDLLTHSPFTLLVPFLLAAAIWLLLKPPRAVRARLASAPEARAALLGVLALCVVGGLVNDSGTAIPAVALLLAVPVAVILGVSGEDRPADR